MKYVLVLVLFIASVGHAAKNYQLVDVNLRQDESKGTFVHNGQTRGFIVGGDYRIKITESTMPGVVHFFNGIVSVTPRGSVPTLPQIETAIRADAIAKGIQAQANEFFSNYQAQQGKTEKLLAIPEGGRPVTVP